MQGMLPQGVLMQGGATVVGPQHVGFGASFALEPTGHVSHAAHAHAHKTQPSQGKQGQAVCKRGQRRARCPLPPPPAPVEHRLVTQALQRGVVGAARGILPGGRHVCNSDVWLLAQRCRATKR
jgi:hypothetical protein